MSKQHNAAYLDAVGKTFRVGPIDTKSPGKGEILIRNKAVAINPVDWKVQDTGLFVQSWPMILGEDLAGEVVEVGEGITRFKPGQRVLAHSQSLWSQILQHATFQDLVLVPQVAVVAIPDSMKFEDATVLPLAISTAAAGLYQSKEEICLELDPPSLSPKKSGKTILIWGGSSSVGAAAIQLAVASGLEVATTCSKRNFALVEKLGAKPFDYNTPSIVGDLVAELQKGSFVGAYDCEPIECARRTSTDNDSNRFPREWYAVCSGHRSVWRWYPLINPSSTRGHPCDRASEGWYVTTRTNSW